MQKVIFITGASSGFGKACAEKFACHGYDIIINGRREERLLELKALTRRRQAINPCLQEFRLTS